MFGKEAGVCDQQAWPLEHALSKAFNISPHLIRLDEELQKVELNVKMILPKKQPELFEKMLKSGIATELNLTMKIQKETVR